MKVLNGMRFFETKDIREGFQIGNQKCLELFRRDDFPGRKVGKSWLVLEEALIEYFKSKKA